MAEIMTEDAWDKMVASIEAIHRNEIMSRYGKEVADTANYSWAECSNAIATKVYVNGGMLVATGFNDETGKIGKTEWKKYHI